MPDLNRAEIIAEAQKLGIHPDVVNGLIAKKFEEKAEKLRRTFTDSAKAWFLRFGVLKNIEGVETRYPKLKLRVVQERVFDHHDLCLVAKKPCKQLVLKPRKDGASTGIQGCMYHRGRHFPGRAGAVMGDIIGTSDTIFEIYRGFAENDQLDWGDGLGSLKVGDKVNNLTDDITLPNKSTYKKVTAGSSNANRSGTIQHLNGTEVAYYPTNLERDPLTGFIGSWHDQGEASYGAMDTTSNGPFGKFYDYFMDERNDWFKIFVAWFEEPDHRLPFESVAAEARFQRDMDRDMHELKERFGLGLDQLHWRYDKLVNKCGGSIEQLNKEFPSSIEEAFLRKSALRFNIRVLEIMERQAKVQAPQVGDFVTQADGGVSFVPEQNGAVKIFEEPRFGCKYFGAFDPSAGAGQQSKRASDDPDFHAGGILRDEYLDPRNGEQYPPMIVASTHSRLPAEAAVAQMAAMSVYYGKCQVVVETNGVGLFPVKELARLNIPLWARKQKGATPGQSEMSDGWNSTPQLRKTLIDTLGSAIGKWTQEEPTMVIWDLDILRELKSMIVRDGWPEAMPGEHDDLVFMLAMAYYLRSCASTLQEPKRKKIDINKLLKREGWARPPQAAW